MSKIVHYEVTDTNGGLFLKDLEKDISNALGNKKDILLNYPSVYIHYWKNPAKPGGCLDQIYIGESNNVLQRTRQHFNDAKDERNWQNDLLKQGHSSLYIFGHEHFNKSLTLDIENRLIDYMVGTPNVHSINGRGNPQGEYFPSEEFDQLFHDIWTYLRRQNERIFISETKIKDSAIFKASPLHKLTPEQASVKAAILNKVKEALLNEQRGQLVFVEGDAGTGKTVLASSTFYELVEKGIDDLGDKKITCKLLVNHDEQITVYKEIAKKLHLDEGDGDIVSKPTHFIISNKPEDPVDVVFVDEAHLLLTRGKQSYTGKNQLDDIIKRARVTVVMFDINQILASEEYWESEKIQEYRDLANDSNNLLKLQNQLRMSCGSETINWIDSITKDGTIIEKGVDATGYELVIFDDPKSLYGAIKKKSEKQDSSLSRLIASYDWPYSSTSKPLDGNAYWEVSIGDFHMPWNRELQDTLNRKEKRAIKTMAWAEQPHTINEIGSTFTIQGFDLHYAGVIIGPSVKYRDGKIVFDPSCSKNNKATGKRTFSNGKKKSVAEELLKHELRVLLTRGSKGLYIYACDKELNAALKNSVL